MVAGTDLSISAEDPSSEALRGREISPLKLSQPQSGESAPFPEFKDPQSSSDKEEDPKAEKGSNSENDVVISEVSAPGSAATEPENEKESSPETDQTEVEKEPSASIDESNEFVDVEEIDGSVDKQPEEMNIIPANSGDKEKSTEEEEEEVISRGDRISPETNAEAEANVADLVVHDVANVSICPDDVFIKPDPDQSMAVVSEVDTGPNQSSNSANCSIIDQSGSSKNNSVASLNINLSHEITVESEDPPFDGKSCGFCKKLLKDVAKDGITTVWLGGLKREPLCSRECSRSYLVKHGFSAMPRQCADCGLAVLTSKDSGTPGRIIWGSFTFCNLKCIKTYILRRSTCTGCKNPARSLPRGGAICLHRGTQVHFFCSLECRDGQKFCDYCRNALKTQEVLTDMDGNSFCDQICMKAFVPNPESEKCRSSYKSRLMQLTLRLEEGEQKCDVCQSANHGEKSLMMESKQMEHVPKRGSGFSYISKYPPPGNYSFCPKLSCYQNFLTQKKLLMLQCEECEESFYEMETAARRCPMALLRTKNQSFLSTFCGWGCRERFEEKKRKTSNPKNCGTCGKIADAEQPEFDLVDLPKSVSKFCSIRCMAKFPQNSTASIKPPKTTVASTPAKAAAVLQKSSTIKPAVSAVVQQPKASPLPLLAPRTLRPILPQGLPNTPTGTIILTSNQVLTAVSQSSGPQQTNWAPRAVSALPAPKPTKPPTPKTEASAHPQNVTQLPQCPHCRQSVVNEPKSFKLTLSNGSTLTYCSLECVAKVSPAVAKEIQLRKLKEAKEAFQNHINSASTLMAPNPNPVPQPRSESYGLRDYPVAGQHRNNSITSPSGITCSPSTLPYMPERTLVRRPVSQDEETQTPKEWEVKPALLPVPVPVYVPVPVQMWTQPTPYAIPMPLPVPVPLVYPNDDARIQSLSESFKALASPSTGVSREKVDELLQIAKALQISNEEAKAAKLTDRVQIVVRREEEFDRRNKTSEKVNLLQTGALYPRTIQTENTLRFKGRDSEEEVMIVDEENPNGRGGSNSGSPMKRRRRRRSRSISSTDGETPDDRVCSPESGLKKPDTSMMQGPLKIVGPSGKVVKVFMRTQNEEHSTYYERRDLPTGTQRPKRLAAINAQAVIKRAKKALEENEMDEPNQSDEEASTSQSENKDSENATVSPDSSKDKNAAGAMEELFAGIAPKLQASKKRSKNKKSKGEDSKFSADSAESEKAIEDALEIWDPWISSQDPSSYPESSVPSWVNFASKISKDITEMPKKELCDSLCHFVKEVRAEDESKLPPGKLFYAALGLQIRLNCLGRKDNLFLDSRFKEFASSFDQICQDPPTTANPSDSPANENLLWSCHQLGGESPMMLLQTLIYLLVKNFRLASVQELIDLKFSRFGKYGKKDANGVMQSHWKLFENGKHKAGELSESPNEAPERSSIKLMELYLSKCPAKAKSDLNGPFFLAPENNFGAESSTWFKREAAPQNLLARILNRVKLVAEIAQSTE